MLMGARCSDGCSEFWLFEKVEADGLHHLTTAGTSVELDAASQVEATSAMASRGQIAVGWCGNLGWIWA